MIEGYYIPRPNPEGRTINRLLKVLERAAFQGDLTEEEAAGLVHDCTGCFSPDELKARYDLGSAALNGNTVHDYGPTEEEIAAEELLFQRPNC